MNNQKGYLLLESVVSLLVISILILLMYSLLVFSINLKETAEDRVELQQQAIEVSKKIEDIIENSVKIENIGCSSGEFSSVKSIKCKYIYRGDVKFKEGTKEIILKDSRSKLFINSFSPTTGEMGEYEIGDYVDEMRVAISNNGACANVILKLSKNKQKYETRLTIYLKSLHA